MQDRDFCPDPAPAADWISSLRALKWWLLSTASARGCGSDTRHPTPTGGSHPVAVCSVLVADTRERMWVPLVDDRICVVVWSTREVRSSFRLKMQLLKVSHSTYHSSLSTHLSSHALPHCVPQKKTTPTGSCLHVVCADSPASVLSCRQTKADECLWWSVDLEAGSVPGSSIRPKTSYNPLAPRVLPPVNAA